MTKDMKIQNLTSENIDEILQLEERGTPAANMYFRYDRKELEQLCSDEQAGVFGIFDEGTLIAWASYRVPAYDYTREDGVYEMSSMVVDPKYRRKGVGLTLFNHRLKELLKKKDLTMIYVTAHPANTPIICLYLNNGFVIYDFKNDKYGPGADRVYMRYAKGDKKH